MSAPSSTADIKVPTGVGCQLLWGPGGRNALGPNLPRVRHGRPLELLMSSLGWPVVTPEACSEGDLRPHWVLEAFPEAAVKA